MNKLYPLKFYPILKDKIWGGKKLREILNKDTHSDKVGESWELSGVNGNISIVSNGFLEGNNLQELIEVYMGDFVGDNVYEKFGTEFPLLIKFIDATDKLSIQVHPNDELAKKRHGTFGKTEMWYIVQADVGGEIIIGFNQTLNKEKYIKHLHENSLMEILNIEKASVEDVFFLPAGRVHAIGKGLLLAEIQQTSDITYRIYDYERKDDKGNFRELHTDLALDSIDYNYYNQYKTDYEKKINGSSGIISCDYFTTNFIDFEEPIEKEYISLDSFIVYICTEGEYEIKYDINQFIHVKKGDTVLIPAMLKHLTLLPKQHTSLLEVYVQ